MDLSTPLSLINNFASRTVCSSPPERVGIASTTPRPVLFFGRFKTECIVSRTFPFFEDTYSVIQRYMYRYNEDRRHSDIGYQTPNQI